MKKFLFKVLILVILVIVIIVIIGNIIYVFV